MKLIPLDFHILDVLSFLKVSLSTSLSASVDGAKVYFCVSLSVGQATQIPADLPGHQSAAAAPHFATHFISCWN